MRLAAGWRFAEFEHTVGPVPLTSSSVPTVAAPKEAGGGAAAKEGAGARDGARDDAAKRARRAKAGQAARGVTADLRRSVSVGGGMETCAVALIGTEGRGGELGAVHSYSAEEARNTVMNPTPIPNRNPNP